MNVVGERIARVITAGVGCLYALLSIIMIIGGAEMAIHFREGGEGPLKVMALGMGVIIIFAGVLPGLVARACLSLYRRVKLTSHISGGAVALLCVAGFFVVCALAIAWGFYH